MAMIVCLRTATMTIQKKNFLLNTNVFSDTRQIFLQKTLFQTIFNTLGTEAM